MNFNLGTIRPRGVC